jgi:predicted dehydrogenase
MVLRIGIIGAGHIAGPYGQELIADPEIEVRGVANLLPERAQTLAAKLGVPAYPSVDALLADPDVDAAVNLTIQRAHAGVGRQVLEAGKHLYSEKPLALQYADARDLLALAADRGRRIAAAPATLLGEAQQTVWKLIREGAIGTVRAAYAECNWGRIEAWHPAPEAFYETGVMPDVGIYPLSIFTALFGPVRRVQAFGTVILPDRTRKDGRPFHVTTPEFVIAVLGLESGVIARLTANWYVDGRHSRQRGMEFHGDLGSIVLSSWLNGDAEVELGLTGQDLAPVPLVRPADRSVVWSRALPDLARAIEEGRPHRMSGEQAAHLVEVMNAITRSAEMGSPVEVTSSFPRPEPMEWAQHG